MADPRATTHIAIIGNHPPRMCGIATFTDDVRKALIAARPGLTADLYAMDEPGSLHDYPDHVVCQISQNDLADYRAAARRINASGAEIVCVQHEYGIFGGPAGAYLLELLDLVEAPVVVTLHTVLQAPRADQRRVIDRLARRAARLIVMAERGRRMLEEVHGIPRSKIAVVPHGVPDRPLADIVAAKHRFGFEGRDILFTFGLLSPNKGIETMIRALPAIVAEHPRALYVVLGATHPHLVAREGQAYRESLVALARELGVEGHVLFINAFAETGKLLDYLEAVDIYVIPYLNEAQITSGTLSYAVALGKPVVSTPFWHAAELIGPETGVLVPFGDDQAFAREISALLADDGRRESLRRAAHRLGRTMIWSRFAAAYLEIFDMALSQRPIRLPVVVREPRAEPCLGAIEQLSDNCGILQHSAFCVPNRHHGYCVDDNARALILMHRLGPAASARSEALATTYAAFVHHAWNPEAGAFRNFMAYDRRWLEETGSQDSFGRSLWSLGVTTDEATRQDLRNWARHLFDEAAPHALRFDCMRSRAFALLGAVSMLRADPGHAVARRIVETFGRELQNAFRAACRADWRWFEPVLAYDNARIPEALLLAGQVAGDGQMIEDALEALKWLDAMQTADAGHFRAVGTESFRRRHARPLPFDQQPLEAWATVDAAITAFEATGDPRWRRVATRAWRWYLGDNDLGMPMASLATGSCFDGLMRDKINLNTGAESVLAFQLACCAVARISGTAGDAAHSENGAIAV
jgi:glycosyltransferase involved in cell wall biosynthesis